MSYNQSSSSLNYRNNPYSSKQVLSSSQMPRSESTLVYKDKKQSRNKSNNLNNNIESYVEKAIVESENPIDINDAEQIYLNNNEKGYWINREEVENWRGELPINEYKLNEDSNPLVIKKKPSEKLKYKQEIQIKYLKPPTPKPSEIIVFQEPSKQAGAAPPLVIRTAPAYQASPEPIIIREAPPRAPSPSRKIIYVPGKMYPPPDRKVVVERLPETPQKPQKIIVERWLKPKIPKPKITYCNQVRSPRTSRSKYEMVEPSLPRGYYESYGNYYYPTSRGYYGSNDYSYNYF